MMPLAHFIRAIGPVKLILAGLLSILPILEFSDGVLGLDDFGAAFIFVLLINDLFHNALFQFISGKSTKVMLTDMSSATSVSYLARAPYYRIFKDEQMRVFNILENSYVPLYGDPLEDPHWQPSEMKRTNNIKALMTVLFVLMCLASIIMDWMDVTHKWQDRSFLISMILWSMIFFRESYFAYRRVNRPVQLIYCQVAIFVLIGSLISL